MISNEYQYIDWSETARMSLGANGLFHYYIIDAIRSLWKVSNPDSTLLSEEAILSMAKRSLDKAQKILNARIGADEFNVRDYSAMQLILDIYNKRIYKLTS